MSLSSLDGVAQLGFPKIHVIAVVANVLVILVPSSAEPPAIRPLTTLDGKVYQHPPVKLDGSITQVNASKLQESLQRSRHQQQDGRREEVSRAKWKKIKNPRPSPRPGTSLRKQVAWYDESHSFAWKASVDNRLLVRHASVPADGTPWPIPQIYYPNPLCFRILPTQFRFFSLGEPCDILEFALDRIKKNMFGDLDEEDVSRDEEEDESDTWWLEPIYHVNVTVLKECAKYPSLEMDETYDLEVKRTGAVIISREIWGALRGLETFSQIVYQNEDGRYMVNKTSIHDFPRFPHRGVLIDTARHYIRKEVIIENLEAMAQNKMNVFHWHMVDDQSFPFYSKTFPNVTLFGAYDPVTHIYTHRDVMEIIEEARLRGIRVIPEFDSPGHTMSWGFGQDYLLTPCYDYRGRPDGYFGPINPILKSTYQFLYHMFREVLTLFPEKYVHLGGDEVPFDCWISNPQISSFMKRNNLTAIEDMFSLYEKKLLEIVTTLGNEREQGSGYITWQEVIDHGIKVKPDTIVQIWMGDASDIERVTNAGLRVIYSTCWYLDYISYGMDWDKYYRCPHMGTMLNDYKLRNESLLLGGEAALWTEYADDDSITPRLWPRASATAERLWSHKSHLNPLEAAPRMEAHRCRMIQRGLRVGVASGPGHCTDFQRKFKKKKRPRDERILWQRQEDSMEIHAKSQNVYVVDMNAMYLVPVLIVVCFCCLTLLSLVNQDSKSRMVALLTYPISGSNRKGVKNLMYVFLLFVVVWSIWSSPMWMNTWETQHHRGYEER